MLPEIAKEKNTMEQPCDPPEKKALVYTVYQPLSRLLRIMKVYEGIFPPKKASLNNLLIPPGWVDIVELALKEAAACPENGIQVRAVWVEEGTLKVDFMNGNEAAQTLFLSILHEAQAYCPCCGHFFEDATSRIVNRWSTEK